MSRAILVASFALILPLLAIAAQPVNDNRSAADDVLTRVQAADVLCDLLTYVGDLAISRADAMRAFMDERGKMNEFRVRGGGLPRRKYATYNEVFEVAVLFVQQGGSKHADPALTRMTPDQLKKELDALQHFNLQQYLFINTQRDDIARMRAYLDSVGEFQSYLDWSQQQLGLAAGPTTRPTTQSTQAAAHWLQEQLSTSRARAWEKAKAAGMSETEFDEQWTAAAAQLRKEAAQRIDAVKTLGAYFHPRSQYVATQPTTAYSAESAVGGGAPLPPQMTRVPGHAPIPRPASNDPRWQANYYGPNNPYNSFADDFSDVMTPSAGGGTYRRYDMRVNTDHDLRAKGELDRRVNVSSDRRMNIRVDPRANF